MAGHRLAAMHLLVVFNPAASAGRAPDRVQALTAAFAEYGVAVTVLETRHPGHATQLLCDFDPDSMDGVVAAGGDGTLHEVVNGLCALPADRRPPLGVVPLGTGNAFSRDLGLAAGDWRSAVKLIADNQRRSIDVAEVRHAGGSFHFINIMGLGLAEEAGRFAARYKKVGRMAYTLGVLRAVAGRRSIPLRIEADKQVLEQESLMLEISNSRYTGTRFLIAPAARLDDGLLDLTLVRPMPLWRLLFLFTKIFSGAHVNYPEVTTLQARRIRLSKPGGLALAPDGEFHGATPAEVICRPRALEIFCGRKIPVSVA